MKSAAFGGVFFLAFACSAAKAASSLSLDSALAFTSNADLSQNDPVSDFILRIGGISRFPMGAAQGRILLRYVDYAKRNDNDLILANLGANWPGKTSRDKSVLTYGLRAALRDYVHQQAGTTDESFTHYGVIGSASWTRPSAKSGNWEFTPQVDLEHYPNYGNRNDGDLSFRAEFSTERPDGEFSFSATPGVLHSSESDFSKLYLGLSADYERSLDESSRWGGYATLTPSFYLSRASGTTTLVLVRNGRRGSGSATTAQEKEQTLLFTPGIWWAKDLNIDWEFRAESFLNIQSSKSDSYNYVEFQVGASLRYRIF